MGLNLEESLLLARVRSSKYLISNAKKNKFNHNFFLKYQKIDLRTLVSVVSKSYPQTDLATDFGAGEEKIMRSNGEFTNQALEESVLMSTEGDIRCSNMSTPGALIRNEKS